MSYIQLKIKSFQVEELKCKCGCGRINISEEFLICLQAFRYMLNMRMMVTSCCRCIKHNKNVGGVETSLHQCETKPTSACDFFCSNMKKAYDLACKCGLFNEVIWYKNKGFIHIGIDKNQNGDYFIIK